MSETLGKAEDAFLGVEKFGADTRASSVGNDGIGSSGDAEDFSSLWKSDRLGVGVVLIRVCSEIRSIVHFGDHLGDRSGGFLEGSAIEFDDEAI